MKKQIFMRWFWCLLEYLMVCPIILVIAGFSLPEGCVVPFILVLPFHMLFAIGVTSVLRKFRKILTAFIGVVYTAGFSWLWVTLFHIDTIGGMMVTVVGTGILLIYGIRTGTAGSLRESFYYTIGLLIHATSVYLTHQAPVLLPFQTIALILAFLFVLGGLPLANRRFLIRETEEKSSLHIIPRTVLRGNKIILSILLVGIILLSFWKTFLDAIVYATGKIAELIGRFLTWLSSFNKATDIPPGGGGMELPPAEQSNPVFALIQDIITYLIFLIVVLFILRYFVKNFKRIYASIFSWFSSIFGRFRKWSTEEQGYVDKQESLLKTDAPKRSSFLAKLFRREPKWRDMKDNNSKVRFLYGRLVLDHIRRGFSFSQSETPGETLERIQSREKDEKPDHSSLRNAYLQARYGNKETDDETVKAMKDAYL